MSRKRTAGARGRRAYATGERFAAIPLEVLESPAFAALTGTGVRVLLALAAQYRGANNGRLTLPLTAAQSLGIRSKDSLHRGLSELRDVGLIEVTEQGGLPPHGCSRYALTFRAIDPAEGAGLVASPPSHRWNGYTGERQRRQAPRRTNPREPSREDGENRTTAPTIGPHCPDHRTTRLPHWSDHRTTSPGLLVRSSDPSYISGGGDAERRVSKLVKVQPHLTDSEVARITHTDAMLVARVRLGGVR